MTAARDANARLAAWKCAAEDGEFPDEIMGLTTEPDGFPLPSGSSSLDLDRIERWLGSHRRHMRLVDRLLIAGLFLVLFVLAGIVIADDGMTRCQLTHSFDVCHASLR